MKEYFAYTRVSTVKQGERGVSLQEQKAAIEAFAFRQQMPISRWFEELETAAARGRPVFNRMMNMLKDGKAAGVIIHKIDRSTRNLRDWSDLGELIDHGVELHFANESLDLQSRGGRLSADIQAVVASDFIRNLRDETRKGMRGRYKQGLFPLPAPLGYVDQGRAKPKLIDPVQGPLVKRMFELYASARYGQTELEEIMYTLGLRTKRGQRVGHTTIGWILANPFYYGLIRLKATGELFEGIHKPLISRSLFNAVREVASQKHNKKAYKHDFSFRRIARCAMCGYNLTGEMVKGINYYRCHSKTCPTNSIREVDLDKQIKKELMPLTISESERFGLQAALDTITQESVQQRQILIRSARANLASVNDRLSKLADAYLDGLLDKDLLSAKQKTLLMERKDLEERLVELQNKDDIITTKLKEFLDFAGSITETYTYAAPFSRQQLLRKVSSRITVADKSASLVLHRPYQLFAARERVRSVESSGVVISEGKDLQNFELARTLAITEQNVDLPLSSAKCEQFGCPSQETLRTLTGLLKLIGECLV
jgi:DNA invertase Pin-like site-specific DNA recombinase